MLPPDPQDGFSEPWQIQAFALTHALADAGAFSWSEWSDTLSRYLHAADAKADASDYYDRWMWALQDLMIAKGIADGPQIETLTEAWQAAARATPHGQPIELKSDVELT